MCMNVLVVYDSLTGNTERVAQSINDDLKGKGAECTLSKVRDAGDLSGYDLIFVGTPVHARSPTRAVRKLVSSKELKGKNVAVFDTYAAFAGELVLDKMQGVLEKTGASVVGRKSIKGRPNEDYLNEYGSWASDILSASMK